MIDLFLILLLVLVGFAVGVVSSMVGVGGGVFIVPLLTLFFLFQAQTAVGTSLTVVIFTALASTYAYYRQRRVDYKVGLLLSVSSVPGAVVGAYLTNFVTSQQLVVVFAVFLILVAVRMLVNFKQHFKVPQTRCIWRRCIVDSENHRFEYCVNVPLVFALAFFGGLSSGLLGIGGGAFMVPILSFIGNLPMHITIATSMFMMIFASASGVATHIQLGNVNFEFAAYLAIGVVLGSQLGARLAKKASGQLLRRIFGVVLLIVSINLLLDAF